MHLSSAFTSEDVMVVQHETWTLALLVKGTLSFLTTLPPENIPYKKGYKAPQKQEASQHSLRHNWPFLLNHDIQLVMKTRSFDKFELLLG